MSNLSEEKAIKEIENYLDYEGSVSINAIATLYTLYNKEKEKNKELDKQLAIDTAKEVLHWKGKYFLLSRKIDVISKDKIKEKIKEYSNTGITINVANRSAGKTFVQAVNDEVTKVLKELLEEVK